MIVTLCVAFFMTFTKCSRNIFFILYLIISVLPLNTFSLLKYASFVIIILLYRGI